MEWSAKEKCKVGECLAESKDGRFYVINKGGYVALHDKRNPSAGGVACDYFQNAQALAERIAARPDERPSLNYKRRGMAAPKEKMAQQPTPSRDQMLRITRMGD